MSSHPGKFEGEPEYVEAFWEDFLNGGADDRGPDDEAVFFLTPEDWRKWGALDHVEVLVLWESDQGFVGHELMSRATYERRLEQAHADASMGGDSDDEYANNPERSEAWRRGYYDASRNRPRLFRRVGSDLVAEIDDPMEHNWDEDAREDYMEGYDAGYEYANNPDDDEGEDDFDLDAEMESGLVIGDARGGGYSLSFDGRYIDEFRDFDEALKAGVQKMEASNYFPNVFHVNDHGNVDLLRVKPRLRKGKVIGVSYETVRSWV